MTCSRCSAAIVTPEQAERGLCAMCLTGASLSALVGVAMGCLQVCSCAPDPTCVIHGTPPETTVTTTDGPFMAPIYFGNKAGSYLRSDAEWKRDTFPQETQ